MPAAPRAITLEADAGKRFLAGAWTTVSRVGKYPQNDLTEERADQLEASYDKGFECGVFNLDHKGDGPALAKIEGVRRRGRDVQIKVDPASVQKELTDAVTSGAYFRPSIEVYPAFSQLEGSPAYLRGVALLGNKSAQVRGLPPIEFSAGGQTYVGLGDADRGYICLDSGDWEDNMPAGKTEKDTKTPADGNPPSDVAKLEAEKVELAAKAKAKDDEIATLKASLAAKETETADLSGRVKAIETQAAKDRASARTGRITDGLALLRKDRKVSPAEIDGWTALLAAMPDTASDVVKLGAGDKTTSHDLIGGVLAVLGTRPVVPITFKDVMKSGGVDDVASLDDCADRAKELTEAAILEKKITRGAEAQAYYLQTEKTLREKFLAGQN